MLRLTLNGDTPESTSEPTDPGRLTCTCISPITVVPVPASPHLKINGAGHRTLQVRRARQIPEHPGLFKILLDQLIDLALQAVLVDARGAQQLGPYARSLTQDREKYVLGSNVLLISVSGDGPGLLHNRVDALAKPLIHAE